jgi:small subunit ribosomal protein S17
MANTEKTKKAGAVAEPEADRMNRRKIRQGIVVSNKMAKTVVVKIERRVQHPLYGKIVLRTERFKAHDETNMCDVGDVVELMETRPMSKEKRFRVTRIVEKVK